MSENEQIVVFVGSLVSLSDNSMTIDSLLKSKFVCKNKRKIVEKLKIIAFTHKNTDVNDIGRFHIEDEALADRLGILKSEMKLDELLFLSTCNRVEFIVSTNENIDSPFLRHFFKTFNSSWTDEQIQWSIDNAQVYLGEGALRHLFSVASSIDSLVVGEREIITQVRTAYEKCSKLGLTGDLIRVVIKKTIETAKDVYTETGIANNPVSVVSLAYRQLRDMNVKQDARFLIIGSGVTNANFAKYLKKHKFANFTVFNRTLKNAEKLANELNARALPLDELPNFKEGFDIIVTCTGSSGAIVTPEIYKSLIGNDTSRKVVIDLAIPNDLDPEIMNSYDVHLIAIEGLQKVAKTNLMEREKEMVACHSIIEKNIIEFKDILRERKVVIAMSDVPKRVKEISQAAKEVFAKDLSGLDVDSKEVLDKILAYMEKKYISGPMKLAKEILLEETKVK